MKNTRKKRLCIVIPGHWSRIMGGSQYQAKCFIEELAKSHRYDLYYLTRDSDPNYTATGFNLVRYGYPGVHKQGTHRHLIEMVMLPKILKKIDPDIIYQRVGCAQTGIAARYALKNGCKMIWHAASEYDLLSFRIPISRLIIERALDKYLLNYGIRNAAHVILQTEDQKKLLLDRYPDRPSTVIRNFHPAPQDTIHKKDPIKIVWISNLKDLKQPEIFINLAHELQHLSNTEFIMVGALQGAERTKQGYRDLIARTRKLNYIGPKSQKDVNSILAESHIFVNTSKREGFPNTFIQSWMRQIPVVSLTVDPDRLIEKKQLGFVSGSFEKLKKDVTFLAENHTLRTQMGVHAQIFAQQFFSTKNVEQIVQIMEG